MGDDLILKNILLAFASLVPLGACSQPSISNNEAAETSPQALADASKTDQNLIVLWGEAHEECVGGIDEKVYEPWCKKRDALQDRLKKNGWCWGSPMEKSAAEDDWHRCGTNDTDNMSNADALIAKADIYLQQGDGGGDGSPTTALDSHMSDWYNEQHRTKSALLQTYENAIEPVMQKIGLAKVLTTCGIRGKEWHHQMLATLNTRLHSSVNEEMAQRLTPADAKAAAQFEQTVIDGMIKIHLDGRSQDAACRSISNMPFAASDATFLP